MKKNKFFNGRLSGVFAFCLMLGALISFNSCTENIDDSNFAIKTELTITDYLEQNPEYSDIKAIFDKVKLGNKEFASSISSVLSARGNYTVFVPTNEAVRAYVMSLTGSEDYNTLSAEDLQHVAYSCVIDNVDDPAYESPEFPKAGTFGLANLSDRLLTCDWDEETDEYIINGNAVVVKADIEATNGMIHQVNAVIAPSQETVADLILRGDNTRIMAALLKATHWADSMTLDRDLVYDEVERNEKEAFSGVWDNFPVQQSRYYGYTVFVETDDVFQQWGIPAPIVETVNEEVVVTNEAEIVKAVYDKATATYGSEVADDYTNAKNALHRFVAYHVLPAKIAYNRFVHHLNEFNYDPGSDYKEPQTTNLAVNVWDYYTTMGQQRGLLKVTQTADGENGIYINRVSKHDTENYAEISHATGEGLNIMISPTNGENTNDAKNGFYYPINAVLLYGNTAREKLGSERMRIDVTTMLPEMLSNNIRANEYRYLPTGYFDNIFNESVDTRIFYLQCGWGNSAFSWNDYQGDEFLFAGMYDFTLKLPPVPVDQTYEVRMGVAHNQWRGMAQVYFGDNPQNLLPAGLPIDMRQGANNNPAIPLIRDVEDEAVNMENDKNLRNQGIMKAPNYFTTCGTKGQNPCREYWVNNPQWPTVRHIIATQRMEPGKTYYLRFKSALEDRNAQFFVDYFEIVPSQVYNGTEPEDIW